MTDTPTAALGPCACGSTSWTVTVWKEGEDRATLECNPEAGTFTVDGLTCPWRQCTTRLCCDRCGRDLPEVPPAIVDLVFEACPDLLGF